MRAPPRPTCDVCGAFCTTHAPTEEYRLLLLKDDYPYDFVRDADTREPILFTDESARVWLSTHTDMFDEAYLVAKVYRKIVTVEEV